MPNSELKQGVFWTEKVEQFEKKKKLENINCETIIDDNRKETEQHNEVVGTSDVLAVESVEDLQLGGMVSSER